MKTESELLDIQWNKYIKWTLRFPLVLAGMACGIVLISLVLALGISLANNGDAQAIILIILSILGLSGISLGWSFYISRVMKASHKIFILLKLKNRKLAIQCNTTYIFLSFLIFIAHLPYFIMNVISQNLGVISFLPFFLLITPIIYFYYKITNHYKSKNINCNWKGISCE